MITALENKDAVKQLHLKHIEEISKNLAPLKFARLTQDQQHFLDRTGPYARYRPASFHESKEEVEEEDQW